MDETTPKILNLSFVILGIRSTILIKCSGLVTLQGSAQRVTAVREVEMLEAQFATDVTGWSAIISYLPDLSTILPLKRTF